jgi:hypothetical protein
MNNNRLVGAVIFPAVPVVGVVGLALLSISNRIGHVHLTTDEKVWMPALSPTWNLLRVLIAVPGLLLMFCSFSAMLAAIVGNFVIFD